MDGNQLFQTITLKWTTYMNLIDIRVYQGCFGLVDLLINQLVLSASVIQIIYLINLVGRKSYTAQCRLGVRGLDETAKS